MHPLVGTIIAVLLLATPAEKPGGRAAGAQAETEARSDAQAIGALGAGFDRLLEDRDGYRDRVRRECRTYPEGDLFPFLLPAMAYGNLALAGTITRREALDRMELLIHMAEPYVVRRLDPPDEDLSKLTGYRNHATYLCQFNLALGSYRLLGGTGRPAELHRHLSGVIKKALESANGQPLYSFPRLMWPFDTIPCLASIHLDDLVSGTTDAAPLVDRHLKWLEANAMHEGSGLPLSRIKAHGKVKTDPPRGCELSWRLSLMAQFAPQEGLKLYRRYVKHFWLDRLVVAGFAEWPGGQALGQDVDSGPVFWGIGSAASALGLAATRAFGDTFKTARLVAQLQAARGWLEERLGQSEGGRTTVAGMLDISADYFTGFLFGDAVLFYALTWQRWEGGGR